MEEVEEEEGAGCERDNLAVETEDPCTAEVEGFEVGGDVGTEVGTEVGNEVELEVEFELEADER